MVLNQNVLLDRTSKPARVPLISYVSRIVIQFLCLLVMMVGVGLSLLVAKIIFKVCAWYLKWLFKCW